MKMLKNVSVDLIGGVGALAWAVVAKVAIPELGELVDPMVAIAFALAALGRWYAAKKATKKLDSPKPEKKSGEDSEPEKDTLELDE